MHDPELPNGLQDADLETRDLCELANQETRAKKAGRCTHGWIFVNPDDSVFCRECKETFATPEDCEADRYDNLNP